MGSKGGLARRQIQTGFTAQRRTLPLAALRSPQLGGASGFCRDLGGREDANKEGGRVGGNCWQMGEVKSRNDGGVVWMGDEGPSGGRWGAEEKGCHVASVTATCGFKHVPIWQPAEGTGLSF